MRETAITEPEAFAIYAKLGVGRRSLRRLASHLKAQRGPVAPSSAMLMYWSRKHHWQARIAEHDSRVSEMAMERLAVSDANRRAELAEDALDCASEILGKARALVERIDTDDGVRPSVADFQRLISGFCQLIEKHELLDALCRPYYAPDQQEPDAAELEDTGQQKGKTAFELALERWERKHGRGEKAN